MQDNEASHLSKEELQLLHVKSLASEITFFIAMLKRCSDEMLNPDLSRSEREITRMRHCFAVEEIESAAEAIKMRLDAEAVIH